LPVVDVYRIFLPHWYESFAKLFAVLGPLELAQASRYRFDKDRNKFVIGHGWLRRILGDRLKRPPESLELLFGRHGKPFVPGDWEFNLSYGGSWVIIALADRIPVGVDLEPFRLVPEALSIAQEYFSPDERELIERSAEPVRSRHFLTVWSRKEAYLKATGQGLTAPLNRFSVGLADPWICQESGRWGVTNFSCLTTHAAALCAPGSWKWRELQLPGSQRTRGSP
jgi:4'-phosphopantetheinyl transferase